MTNELPPDFVPENIGALQPYQTGMPIEELERQLGITGAIKLASNENPLGPSPRGMEAAIAATREAHRYPDGAAVRLRTAIAQRLGVKPEEVILGAGSNELIELLIRTFCRPGVDQVVTHKYAFVMYRLASLAHGVGFREVDVRPDLTLDVDALVAAVGPTTKLVFLPNPNNPTGLMVGRAEFERLLAKLPPRVILAVDEAYHEYATLLPDYPVAEQYRRADRPFVVTLRTFSKAYGLAALRVGYAVADARIVGFMNRVRAPFNVGTPAQEAARAALDDAEHLERTRRMNAEGVKQLEDGFGKLGLKAWPSAANFVLVDIGRAAAPVYDALLRKGVIVRPLGPLGLDRHLRVSSGLPEENARALRAFAEVLGLA